MIIKIKSSQKLAIDENWIVVKIVEFHLSQIFIWLKYYNAHIDLSVIIILFVLVYFFEWSVKNNILLTYSQLTSFYQ